MTRPRIDLSAPPTPDYEHQEPVHYFDQYLRRDAKYLLCRFTFDEALFQTYLKQSDYAPGHRGWTHWEAVRGQIRKEQADG